MQGIRINHDTASEGRGKANGRTGRQRRKKGESRQGVQKEKKEVVKTPWKRPRRDWIDSRHGVPKSIFAIRFFVRTPFLRQEKTLHEGGALATEGEFSIDAWIQLVRNHQELDVRRRGNEEDRNANHSRIVRLSCRSCRFEDSLSKGLVMHRNHDADVRRGGSVPFRRRSSRALRIALFE